MVGNGLFVSEQSVLIYSTVGIRKRPHVFPPLVLSLYSASGFPLSLICSLLIHTPLALSSTLTLVHTHLLTLRGSAGGTSNGLNVFPSASETRTVSTVRTQTCVQSNAHLTVLPFVQLPHSPPRLLPDPAAEPEVRRPGSHSVSFYQPAPWLCDMGQIA